MAADPRTTQGRSARDDKPRKATVVTVTPIPDDRGPGHNTLGKTAQQADRQAIERSEDDGMIVNRTPTSGVDNRGTPNATAER